MPMPHSGFVWVSKCNKGLFPSMATIAAVGLEKLANEAGVTLDRSAFPVF